MKKFALGMLFLSVICIASCEDDSDDTSPTSSTTNNTNNTGSSNLVIESTPSAKVENDNVSAGVYKGTIVGSSGTFKITINSTTISGVLILDGTSHILTTNDISSSDFNSAISNAKFQNSDGSISLTFSVDANGQNPTVKISAVGHPIIKATIAKETSVKQVKIYEGFRYEKFKQTKDPASGMDTLRSNIGKYQYNFILKGGDSGTGTWIYRLLEVTNRINYPPVDTSLYDSIYVSPFTFSIVNEKLIIPGAFNITNATISNTEINRFVEDIPIAGTTITDSLNLFRKL